MKPILVLIALIAVAFAADDGCTTAGHGHRSPSTDDIVLTVQNEWTLPAGTQVFGLDVYEEDAEIFVFGPNNETGFVEAWDASTGESVGPPMPLDAANTSCFGVAWNNDPVNATYYTNDCLETSFFYTEDDGISWITVASPSGSTNARGMDFDGTNYWTTNGEGGGLYRLFHPGVPPQLLSIPEVPSDEQPSGVAVWDYMGDVAVAVTTYDDHNIWIYIWDGSSLTFFGSAACPLSCSSSYGLAYAEQNGHLYWSFRSGANYHIADLTIDMLSFYGNTWAGIKTSF